MHIVKSLVYAILLGILTIVVGTAFGESMKNSIIGAVWMGFISFVLLWLDTEGSPAYNPDK